MTVTRKTETPLAAAEVMDDEMNGAYAVGLTLTIPHEADAFVKLDAAEAEQLAHELLAASAEAINTYRADNPPAEPFDADLSVHSRTPEDQRWVWVRADHRGGVGLLDRVQGRIMWVEPTPTEGQRLLIETNLRAGNNPYTWEPSAAVQPYEAAVFA